MEECYFLLKLQAKACNFTKSNTPPRVFFTFLNCVNDTKSHKTSHIGKNRQHPVYLRTQTRSTKIMTS